VGSKSTKRFWGTAHVARMLQVSPATVASWIDSGHLKGHRTPTGRRRVGSAELVDFLKSMQLPIPPELWSEARSGGSGGGGRDRDVVVLVDDEPVYVRAVQRYVEQSDLDIELVVAANGVDGLIAIGRHQPALIVLDYRLPDLNATQIIERLMEVDRAPAAEVMVVTGGVEVEEEAALRRLGVQVVLRKSDGMGAVVEMMRAALKRRARRGGAGVPAD
jgi:CheY-like chemotaxis protein